MPTNSKKTRHGRRSLGGRPEKPNKAEFGQITCVLRKDTIELLRRGAGGATRRFGEFLQAHLDRYPLPTREQFLALSMGIPYFTTVKRKKVPTIMAASGMSREAKKLAREQARRDRLSPEERAWEDSIREGMTKVVEKHYAGHSS